MHSAIEARAPQMRNRDAMRLWFDAWNADNERAREEYDRVMSLLEAPIWCRRKLHQLQVRGHCNECRNLRERTRRAISGARYRMTDQEQANAVRLYVDEKKSLTEVASALGLTEAKVRRAVHAAGHQTRTYAEAARLRWFRDL